jgi:hypothetical protein
VWCGVCQTNENGYKQTRRLAIDERRGVLLNFSKRMRVKKLLPLSQLVQIEKMTCNPAMLTLVFSSVGAEGDDPGLDTNYEVVFDDPRRCAEFVSTLMAALPTAEDEDDDGVTPLPSMPRAGVGRTASEKAHKSACSRVAPAVCLGFSASVPPCLDPLPPSCCSSTCDYAIWTRVFQYAHSMCMCTCAMDSVPGISDSESSCEHATGCRAHCSPVVAGTVGHVEQRRESCHRQAQQGVQSPWARRRQSSCL